MTFVDLSHTIIDGMITYKGLPAPLICDFLSRKASQDQYAEGTSFQIGKIEMVGNTGTYMDCPFHRYEDGRDFSELFLSDLVDIPGVRIKIPETSKSIQIEHLTGYPIHGRAVLLYTGWARHWRTDQYFEDHPFVSQEAAQYLKDEGAKIVGIDSHNIDNTGQNTRPVHTILLEAEILIVEHLCQLHLVPASGFLFSAVPPKIKSTGSFPVRAFAKF